MRLFFGIGLSAMEALALADWRDRCTRCDGRAVPAADFHVTLGFLGELQPGRLDALLSSADRLLDKSANRDRAMVLDQVGYWPRPGIFWTGPRSWPDSVNQLAAALRDLAVQFGARRERAAFQPHVTLFRRCQTPPPAPTVSPQITLAAETVSLFESRQGREGVSYHPLAEWH